MPEDTTNYQQKYAQDFKNILKSYNINIDTERTGGYWDVAANVNGAIASQVNYYVQQISQGNNPYYASAFMLEEWASALGLTARKTGIRASGKVKLELDKYPIDVKVGAELSVGNFKYFTVQSKTITEQDNLIEIEAKAVGAEYDIGTGIVMQSPFAGKAISQGIFGGSGRETDLQLLSRILENIRHRKTACMVSDYIQRALEFVNYASGEVLFAEDVVPYGIKMVCANSINDFQKAAKNDKINNIALHPKGLEQLKNKLTSSRSVGAILEVQTIDTQKVTGIEITVTNPKPLTSEERTKIEEEVRIVIMQYRGEYLYPHSLFPDIKNIVTSYYFNNFTPIKRTSPMMDSIDITVKEG